MSVRWLGASGYVYEYQVFDPDRTSWNAVAGNYIFAAQTRAGWRAVYVGQTDERWQAARRHGATHINARVNAAGEKARRVEEADLIRALDPICNRALVPTQ